MATTTWVASTKTNNSTGISILTTELNSLAAGSAALSAEVDNTELDTLVDLELAVNFGTGPTGQIDLYVVRLVDGTNYEDATGGASEVLPKNGYVGSFYPRTVTGTQRMILPEVMVPPRDFKVILYNGTTQAFPASGSTLKAFYYNYKSE